MKYRYIKEQFKDVFFWFKVDEEDKFTQFDLFSKKWSTNPVRDFSWYDPDKYPNAQIEVTEDEFNEEIFLEMI